MRHLALKCLTGIPTIFSSSSRDKKTKNNIYVHGWYQKKKKMYMAGFQIHEDISKNSYIYFIFLKLYFFQSIP